MRVATVSVTEELTRKKKVLVVSERMRSAITVIYGVLLILCIFSWLGWFLLSWPSSWPSSLSAIAPKYILLAVVIALHKVDSRILTESDLQ